MGFLGQQDSSIPAVLQERPMNFCALWIIDNAIVRSLLDAGNGRVMFYASLKRLRMGLNLQVEYVNSRAVTALGKLKINSSKQ